MIIDLNNLGKRYNYQVIFKGLNYTFQNPGTYAVLGSNGSGKSTLLKMISGFLSPSIGELSYTSEDKQIKRDDIFKTVNYVAPYIDLIEEFTLDELLNFHFSFREPLESFSKSQIIDLLNLKSTRNKMISNFSSGMKQRVKLALAFLTSADIILLDEPCSNLDIQGVQWYLDLITKFKGNRILIIASNDEREYSFCENRLQIEEYH